MNPVAVPRYAVGDNAKVALGRTKQALDKANTRLVKSGEWYDNVRTEFGAAR